MSRSSKNFQFNYKNNKGKVYLSKFVNIEEFLNKYNFYLEKEILKDTYKVFNVKINNIIYNTQEFEKFKILKTISLDIKQYDLMKQVETIQDLYDILINNKDVFLDSSNNKLLRYSIDRKQVYTVDEIYQKLKPYFKKFKKFEDIDLKKIGKLSVNFDGDLIYPFTENMLTYFKNYEKEKNIKCCYCGMQADYFAKERFLSNCKTKDELDETRYHLTLYGHNLKNKELYFTKDHIIPKSRGGLNEVSNYQAMCYKCNSVKGNLKEEEFIDLKFEATIDGYGRYYWVVPIKENNQNLYYDVYSRKRSEKPFMRCPSNIVYIH